MDLPVSLNLRWNQNQVLRQTVKQVTRISRCSRFSGPFHTKNPFSKQNHYVRSNLHVTLLHVS